MRPVLDETSVAALRPPLRRYVRGMLSGRLSDAAADARHARFAAACAVNALLEETPAWKVGAKTLGLA